MNIALLVALLLYLVASIMDYYISYVGVHKGSALEGNGLITYLFGAKPSLLQYMLYALGEAVVLSLPMLLLLVSKPIGLVGTLCGLRRHVC